MLRKAQSKVARNAGESGSAQASGESMPLEAGDENATADEQDPPEAFEKLSGVHTLVKYLTKDGPGERPVGERWKEVFLEALARAPIAAVAARVACVPRSQAVAARKSDREFARRWEEALEEGVDEIEAAAFVGAVLGDEKPVYYGGKCVGKTVEHSQAMRTLLLKSRRRTVFGDKAETQERSAPVMMTLAELKARVDEVRRKHESE